MTRKQYRNQMDILRGSPVRSPYKPLVGKKCLEQKGRLIPVEYCIGQIGRISTFQLDKTLKHIGNMFTTVDRLHNGRKRRG